MWFTTDGCAYQDVEVVPPQPAHRERPFRRVTGAGSVTTVTSRTVIFRQIPSSISHTGKVPCEYCGS